MHSAQCLKELTSERPILRSISMLPPGQEEDPSIGGRHSTLTLSRVLLCVDYATIARGHSATFLHAEVSLWPTDRIT